MDETNSMVPSNGDQSHRMTERSPSSQQTFNDTISRTAERNCTQKLTIHSLEKHDGSSANLCWRKFVQYIKMKEIDISTMVNSKEILQRYREQLETELKDIFLWAIGQNARTEMTKTIREREPSGRLDRIL